MKKIWLCVMAIIASALLAVGFVGCGGGAEYTITFKDAEGEVLWEQSFDAGAEVTYGGEEPVKQATAEYTYQFAGWKDAEGVVLETLPPAMADAEYTAAFNAVKNKYSVKFVSEGTVLQEDSIEYGAAVQFRGQQPSKAATAAETFIFDGWSDGQTAYGAGEDLPNVTKEVTYTAVFKTDKNEYKVTWNVDGVLKEEYFEYGTKAVFDGTEPSKAADAQYTYKFAGWSKTDGGEVLSEEEMTVGGETVFYAVFSKTVNKYTIKFVNGTEELSSEQIAYGEEARYTGATPEKQATAEYEYDFAGWTDGEAEYSLQDKLPDVTGDATYTAVFDSVLRKYTITWVIDGTEDERQAEYGSALGYDGTPQKPSTDDYDFVFKGWSETEGGETIDLSGKTVTGNATYYAVFEQIKKQYTITWNIDGAETSQKVDKGSTPAWEGTPEKEADAQYTYIFAGWSKTAEGEIIDLSSETIQGDITYYAVFTKTVNEYTVAFINGETRVEYQVAYGSAPEYKEAEPAKEADAQYTYEFAGWAKSPDGEPVILEDEIVTGNAEYYSVFTQTIRQYELKVEYAFESGGEEAPETLVLQLPYGTLYGKEQTESPAVEGYLPDRFFLAGRIEGDVSYTVTYSMCDIWDGTVAEGFAGGTGTQEDPYKIATGAQLAYLAQESIKVAGNKSYGDGIYYILTNSIDLNNHAWTPIGYNGGTTTTYKWFAGSFDGNGYTIANMLFDDDTKLGAGLFGGMKGSVSNLTLHGSITAKNRVGGLFYYGQGAEIANVYSYVDINFADAKGVVGGIAGTVEKSTSITGCEFFGNISVAAEGVVAADVGGISGSVTASTVENCANYGSIGGDIKEVGGIAGKAASGAVIADCCNFGTIAGSCTSAGGIAGLSTASTISGCKNYGEISATSATGRVGGIAGNVYSAGMMIEDCENYGNVYGYFQVGGIAGYNTQDVQNCVNYGMVQAETDYAGGIVGQYGGRVSECVNYGEISAHRYGGGIMGGSYKAAITSCTNYGSVLFVESAEGAAGSEKGKGFAGICGWITTSSTVTSCKNHGDVTGVTNVGGIGGYLGAGSTVSEDCTNDGTLDGSSYVGEIVGYDANEK